MVLFIIFINLAGGINMNTFLNILYSESIFMSVTILILVLGICLTNIKNVLSVRVEGPMNLVVFFMLVGIPFVHLQFSFTVATLIVLSMTMLLNTWVVYTMYVEQLTNGINKTEEIKSVHSTITLGKSC